MVGGSNKVQEPRKGVWTKEEDLLLIKCIEKYGEGKWHQVPSRSGLNRCRKSCRLRWLNYLRPNIKRGEFTEDEIDLILRLHKLIGNRWSLIAGRIPGRTANDIKNFWNTHLQKKLAEQRDAATESENPPNTPQVSDETGNNVNDHVLKPRPPTFPGTPTPSGTDHVPDQVKKPDSFIGSHSALSRPSSSGIEWWMNLLEDEEDYKTNIGTSLDLCDASGHNYMIEDMSNVLHEDMKHQGEGGGWGGHEDEMFNLDMEFWGVFMSLNDNRSIMDWDS